MSSAMNGSAASLSMMSLPRTNVRWVVSRSVMVPPHRPSHASIDRSKGTNDEHEHRPRMIVSLPRRSFQPVEPNAELRRKVHVHEPTMPPKPYVMQAILVTLPSQDQTRRQETLGPRAIPRPAGT